MTSRHEPATLISWSLPRQRDVTPYRSPGCVDVLRGARADVTDFSYMTLMDTSVVKHNMLKLQVEASQYSPVKHSSVCTSTGKYIAEKPLYF